MKKNLLLLAAVGLLITGCTNKEEIKNNEGKNNQNNNQQEIVNENLEMSFDERFKEVREYMNQEDALGIGSLGYISKEHFISSATLKKKDDYYVMNLFFHSSKLYDKEEIENAVNLAQETGKYIFDGYTFYKDNNVPIELDPSDTDSLQVFEDLKLNGILAKQNGIGNLVKFIVTPNDASKYCVVVIQFASADGFMVTDKEKDFNVTLLPDDKIRVNIIHSSDESESVLLTVEEFYKKVTNGEKIIFANYGEFDGIDLLYLGDYRDLYGQYRNAVDITEEIVLNYTLGGI